MINMDLMLCNPIKVQLKEGTYSKNFKGLFASNYKLKDFLNQEVGYDKYMSWCQAIILKPKDIADILWVQHQVYYKDLNDWTFLFGRCFDLERNEVIKDSPTLEGLKFVFGYDFLPAFDLRKKEPEEMLFFTILDENGNWLAKIDNENFEEIIKVVKLINHIEDSELSSWNYAYDKHEKRALKHYHSKRTNPIKQNKGYEFSLETMLRFLKVESGLNYKDLFEESLYEINRCYLMKSDTLRTFALNVGIYGGNLKMDSNIRKSLLYGVVHKQEEVRDIATGNNKDSIQIGK